MQATHRGRNASALSRYLSDIRDYPSLSKEQELGLGERISAGALECQNELVVSNLGFVVKIACEYQHLGLPLDDLLNEGNLGLVRAAARYDHRRGIKFITYASFWVRKAILKALADQPAIVRVPEYQRKKLSRHDPARTPLWPRRAAVSLDEPASSQGRARLIDTLADGDWANPEREILKRQDLAGLRRAMCRLNTKERAVIAWRFGLAAEPFLTLKEIGSRLGISRERVRQIEAAARVKLRTALSAPRPPCPPSLGRTVTEASSHCHQRPVQVQASADARFGRAAGLGEASIHEARADETRFHEACFHEA